MTERSRFDEYPRASMQTRTHIHVNPYTCRYGYRHTHVHINVKTCQRTKIRFFSPSILKSMIFYTAIYLFVFFFLYVYVCVLVLKKSLYLCVLWYVEVRGQLRVLALPSGLTVVTYPVVCKATVGPPPPAKGFLSCAKDVAGKTHLVLGDANHSKGQRDSSAGPPENAGYAGLRNRVRIPSFHVKPGYL